MDHRSDGEEALIDPARWDRLLEEGYSPEEVAELRESFEDFMHSYHSTPPEKRRLMSDKFSGPFGVDGNGEVLIVEKPGGERGKKSGE